MLKTVVKKGSYQDSVVLMLLTNELSSLDGVNKIQVMMATPANKDIFKESGLTTDELIDATANDMVVVADVNDEAVLDAVMDKVEEFLKKQSTAAEGKKGSESVKSWDGALKKMSNANLAVISIPGAYAALEADRALDEGLSVFMFSDNVTIEDEKALKEKAHSKGLAVMGPDCGTGIIQGVPIAFTNNVAKGSIGIIGASGTGIQELTTIIDRLGEGVTNAIGIGGRDLKAEVGGITMMDMIDAMEDDDTVKVLVIVSKPPAKEVRDKISARLSNFSKPVVTLFVGEKPEYHEENFYHAYTLDEAARLAVGLVRGTKVPEATVDVDESEFYKAEDGKTIKAYYSGGTLANEAAMLIKDAMNCKVPPEDVEGYMLQLDGNVVVDLGDDAYTQGKPHPMIDPAKRIECMQEAVDDPSTGVVLLDIMLGYGSHADMAGSLIPTIKELQAKDSRIDGLISDNESMIASAKRALHKENAAAFIETAVKPQGLQLANATAATNGFLFGTKVNPEMQEVTVKAENYDEMAQQLEEMQAARRKQLETYYKQQTTTNPINIFSGMNMGTNPLMYFNTQVPEII